jgi:hypothetical protein
MVSQITRNNKKVISERAEYQRFAQDVTTVASVSGLIGVEKDFWTAANGEVYAVVRMNRAECAARYKSMITENERLITTLLKEAQEISGTLEAYENLVFAENIAALTDNFVALLSVLQPSAALYKPSYGSAGAIKALTQTESRLITIEVRVTGDVDNRIAKALAAVFLQRGFRTSAEPGGQSYIAQADFKVEDAGTANNYTYVRFTLAASLKNKNGMEVLAFSKNDRSGHTNQQEARQRAIRDAEKLIVETFAHEFDAHLASLL